MYDPGICLDGLRKTLRTRSEENRWPIWDAKPSSNEQNSTESLLKQSSLKSPITC